jgi:hypothetical protein
MRWIAVLAAAIVVVGAATTAGLTGGQRALAAKASLHPAAHAGFASIPGLTKIASGTWTASLCADLKGSKTRSAQTHRPWYCAQRGRYRDQTWVLRAAARKYGIHHVPLPIPLALARRHPGVSEVSSDVLTLASASVAKRFFPIEAHTAGYSALPQAAINGGIAARIDSPANDGLSEFRFAWIRRAAIVDLNILGSHMTAAEAKRVALRARPS